MEENVVNQNPVQKDRKGFSIAALVLGILALILSCTVFVSLIFGLIAIIVGVLGLKSSKRGMSIAGIVTGAIGMVIAVVMAFVWISLGVYIFNNASEAVNSLQDVEDEINSYYEDYNFNYNTNTDSLYSYDYDF